MGRSGVTLRDATLSDVPLLVELWADVLRKGEPHQLAADVTAIVDGTADAVESRVVVAEVDGRVAGAVLLKLAPMTAINLESTVHVVAPHVFPELRRQGVGRALMDAAVSFAEDRGIGHLRSGSLSMSRDASRFMARLGFGPLIVLRVGATPTVRARLEAQRSRSPRTPAGHRQIAQVLAARRAQRRRELGEAQG